MFASTDFSPLPNPLPVLPFPPRPSDLDCESRLPAFTERGGTLRRVS
jgi:hypothetical protein